MSTSRTPDPAAFGAEGAARYAEYRHGADGAVLIDPYLHEFIRQHAPGKLGVDPGGGTGWLSILAAQAGAVSMDCTDNSAAMLQQARQAVEHAGLARVVRVGFADARALPQASRTFDFGFSSNVGCAVDGPGLCAHVDELARVLKRGARAILTYPNTLEVDFGVDGTRTPLAALDLRGLTTPAELFEALKDEHGIHRATFEFGPDGARAVTTPLANGAEIYRRIPGLVVRNRWHTTDDYRDAIAAARTSDIDGPALIVEQHIAKILSPGERLAVNTGRPPHLTLGPEYERFPAFGVFILRVPE